MVSKKSLDELELIAALLRDVQMSHSEVFTPRSCRLTIAKIISRFEREGIGFLTKTLTRLGKAFDKALTGKVPLDSTGFRKIPGSQLPRFLGELFQCIFSHDGWILPTPCVKSIKSLRQILLAFGKYKLPNDTDQEQKVLSEFERTDDELEPYNRVCTSNRPNCPKYSRCYDCSSEFFKRTQIGESDTLTTIRRAKMLLAELFSSFDVHDIYPAHGPGSVSTKEKGPGKYRWTRYNERITQTYPLDAYFYVSLNHVCDRFQEMQSLEQKESNAKVILVPKDSRGPRLISEEPLEFQWIQQGLGKAIMRHVEKSELTRYNIHFTDQQPNQFGALKGSSDVDWYQHSRTGKFIRHQISVGKYATLDLKEASDRVSIGLVRLLFPEPVLTALLNCRSLSTELPNGQVRRLNKFAPMGSALCFPTLALAVWAILSAGFSDADRFVYRYKGSKYYLRNDVQRSILVYGDDVIVRTDKSEHAIKLLESFGLKVNRDKSCTTGFFRESCGVDAFKGHDVTPVRFRTVWASTQSPSVYTSWIAYANRLWDRSYFNAYDYIVGHLHKIYGAIPCDDMLMPPVWALKSRPVHEDMHFACPTLRWVEEPHRPRARRVNPDTQVLEHLVWAVKTKPKHYKVDGWMMLLRYFTENIKRQNDLSLNNGGLPEGSPPIWVDRNFKRSTFRASEYTLRDTSCLVKCWR